ncbi:hypothetical protein [Senegalia massiliensis]|uniref:VWFA domain-containing protein n=1 Tax=Senegalia massiliensis TaxID=1720316 RepID=A0A845R2H6_9CLOT|nr:hypothetical protein [Senegalia massiliensis]NBI07632.1 hypothetical protein [Senegalia massiliensis]
MFNIDEILSNYPENIDSNKIKKFDTTINHTRMENLIYKEKKKSLDEMYRGIDYTISDIEEKASEKLSSFKFLSQDIFNMFYKVNISDRKKEDLSTNAKKFNKQIIQNIKENQDYGALKMLTEGNDLESIEGTREFIKQLYDNLDILLEDITGNKGTLKQLDKKKKALESKQKQLNNNIDLYHHLKGKEGNKEELKAAEKKIKALHRQVEGIIKQINKFNDIIKYKTKNNRDKIENRIDNALKNSLIKVQEVKDTLEIWGTENGTPQTMEGKTKLIEKIKKNPLFLNIAKELGKLRKLTNSSINKKYTIGRGKKIGIEYGNNLNKILPSELVLLANKETKPIFYKKYVEKKLKQYKEKKEIFVGRGHVIFMADESGSTSGNRAIWTKALAISLMGISVKEHRNFAYIPYDTRVGNIQHVNNTNYSEDIVLAIANSYLGGGTNFTEPIKIASKLIKDNRYENADLVFVTDGHATIDSNVLDYFNTLKKEKKVKCVGILLDKSRIGKASDKTIKKFCDKIYKTSEISNEKIAQKLMNQII